MIRVLAILFFVLMGTEGFAQTRFDGKWTTAQRQNPELLGETERRQGDAQLELTLDAVNVKGALSLGGLGGQFYVFNEGKVDGMKLWFRTTATSGNRKANSTWHVELVDDNTIVLWSWGLDLIGDDVLELIRVMASRSATKDTTVAQPQTTLPAAPPASQATSESTWSPSAAGNPETFCRTHSISRCYLLRRSK
jgi:hypothetical protein